MSWATRRRLLILFVLLVIIGGIVFWRKADTIFMAPSCSDGLKNGDESGIDCGGTMCSTLCTSQVSEPTVLWKRSFAVTDDVYNAVAYIENKNAAATRAIAYEFRLYDANDILAARRTGVTVIPPLGRYAIVETGIQSGTATVAYTAFSFSSVPAKWERLPAQIASLRLTTGAATLDETGPFPKLTALVTNPSPTIELSNTIVAAVLFDANDNAVNVSRTLIPSLPGQRSAPVTFTWPRKLSAPVVRYEILPIVDVFHTK